MNMLCLQWGLLSEIKASQCMAKIEVARFCPVPPCASCCVRIIPSQIREVWSKRHWKKQEKGEDSLSCRGQSLAYAGCWFMCPDDQGSWWYPGLYQEPCGQQDQESDSSPVVSTGEVSSPVSSPGCLRSGRALRCWSMSQEGQ